MELFPTLLRVVVSLAAVLTLVWLLGRFARRRGLGGSVTSESFAVLGRQPLSRTASIALVRVGGTALVVGVAEGSVRLLSSTPLSDVVAPDSVDLTALASTSSASTVAPLTASDPTLTPAPRTPTPAFRTQDADPEPSTTASRAHHAESGSSATPTAAGERSARRAARTQPASALAGSALSPATWTRAVDVLRERTTRR